MADVELVIKIDEKLVEWIDEYFKYIKGFDGKKIGMVVDAIRTGTPLPKGHGRLIDANTVDKSVKDPYQNREVMYWVNNAKTIIEADAESEG